MDKTLWPLAFVVLALLWSGYLYFFPADWLSIMLGLGSGVLLASWAMDVTAKETQARGD